jgi:hypothetical protein
VVAVVGGVVRLLAGVHCERLVDCVSVGVSGVRKVVSMGGIWSE